MEINVGNYLSKKPFLLTIVTYFADTFEWAPKICRYVFHWNENIHFFPEQFFLGKSENYPRLSEVRFMKLSRCSALSWLIRSFLFSKSDKINFSAEWESVGIYFTKDWLSVIDLQEKDQFYYFSRLSRVGGIVGNVSNNASCGVGDENHSVKWFY
jgi:hypothetical protein